MLDERTTICDLRPGGGDHHRAKGVANVGKHAIETAFSMRFTEAEDCFRWLYDFGAEPLTPARASAPDAAGQIFSDALRASLSFQFDHGKQGNWHSWTVSNLARPPVWKVYLNPSFGALRRFELIIGPHLISPHVAAFKTVSQRWMALRPDKLMIYFVSAQARVDWLAKVRTVLRGFPANAVPFTQNFDANGMATLATDPEDLPGQSWRSNLLRNIAGKIVSTDVTSPEQLYDLLICEGIDPDNWEVSYGCQRRSKIRPKGGAKIGHFGVGRDERTGCWRPVDRALQIAGG
ncbi:hypothetical protein [Tateyamaria pelophila]|uniref:hypothetical protein n=1 Tax=Tateyamaria pelophila TaxID=328415 RepID=UPI001CBB42C5|nr:hypothetical protein [Tateyamaria pelophila]